MNLEFSKALPAPSETFPAPSEALPAFSEALPGLTVVFVATSGGSPRGPSCYLQGPHESLSFLNETCHNGPSWYC